MRILASCSIVGSKRFSFLKMFLLFWLVTMLVLPWIFHSQLDSGMFVSNHNWLESTMVSQGLNPLSPPLLHSCNDIFGSHQMVRIDDCLHHQLLKWYACDIGTAWIRTDLIEGSVGSEAIEDVVNRPEAQEQLVFFKGSLLLQNNTVPQYLVNSADTHMKRFLQSAISLPDFQSQYGSNHVFSSPSSRITLLVRRGNYANPCMALLTMYNVYIILEYYCKHFVSGSRSLSIVWLDGHAKGDLDPVWYQLFETQPLHVKQLNKQLSLTNEGLDSSDPKSRISLLGHLMVVNTMSAIGDEGLGLYDWNVDAMTGDNQQGKKRNPSSGLLNSTLVQFRNFVLERYGLKRSASKTKILTLLVRRDYRAHPRSTGQTDRTLANVTADALYLQNLYPTHTLQVVSFEGMPFIEQLRFITSTDVLVAVHGAGNIHVLFLPDDATMVEYIPQPFRQRRRFRFLAECLNVSYVAKPAWIEERRSVDTTAIGERSRHGSKEILKVRLRPSIVNQ